MTKPSKAYLEARIELLKKELEEKQAELEEIKEYEYKPLFG